MVSQDTEKGLTRYCADRGVTRGRALNDLVRIGLATCNYLDEPKLNQMVNPPEPKTPEELRAIADQTQQTWIREHYNEMSAKARDYWKVRYPELLEELREAGPVKSQRSDPADHPREQADAR